MMISPSAAAAVTVPDRPVVILSSTEHEGILNSKALAMEKLAERGIDEARTQELWDGAEDESPSSP